MLALGLDLPKDQFTSMMRGGMSLLAPTGSDLSKYGKKNDILAAVHYDFGLLTIHGKSNFPGLYIWLRNGERVPVTVPDGYLLLQSGRMLEYFTGGYLHGGYHEVIVSDQTLEAIERAKAQGKSLWRISSTMFTNVRYEVEMKPFARFAGLPEAKNYPPVRTYDFVLDELKAITIVSD